MRYHFTETHYGGWVRNTDAASRDGGRSGRSRTASGNGSWCSWLDRRPAAPIGDTHSDRMTRHVTPGCAPAQTLPTNVHGSITRNSRRAETTQPWPGSSAG